MCVQEGATRWTSTFNQLERFKVLYEYILEVASKNYLEAVTSSLPRNEAQKREMMAVIDAYLSILKPFKEATLVAQGSTHPTLPYAARFLLPILNKVPGNLLEPTLADGQLQKEVKKRMYEKLSSYYGMEEQDLLYATAYLDPLHVAKISALGANEMAVLRAMDLLESKLDEELEADKVHHVPIVTHVPATSQQSEDSWEAGEKGEEALGAAILVKGKDVLGKYLVLAKQYRNKVR